MVAVLTAAIVVVGLQVPAAARAGVVPPSERGLDGDTSMLVVPGPGDGVEVLRRAGGSGSDGSFSGVYKACRKYHSRDFCTKIGWWSVKILRMAGKLDVNENQRNAARHFAWVVVLYASAGGEATRAMLRAHEGEQKSPDSARDRKNNKFSLAYFEGHVRSIYRHFGDDGIGEDDVRWLFRRALRLYENGRMFKLCPWGGSDVPAVVVSNDFHCA